MDGDLFGGGNGGGLGWWDHLQARLDRAPTPTPRPGPRPDPVPEAALLAGWHALGCHVLLRAVWDLSLERPPFKEEGHLPPGVTVADAARRWLRSASAAELAEALGLDPDAVARAVREL